MSTQPLAMRIDELPLWRLLVALADAEKVAGADSGTARALAREVSRRLAGPVQDDSRRAKAPRRKGGTGG